MTKPATQKGGTSTSVAPPKPKREVQVVTCPGAFPISTKPQSARKRPREDDEGPLSRNIGRSSSSDKRNIRDKRDGRDKRNGSNDTSSSTKLLDWHDTAKEIRAYGATAFVGQQKRDYEDEQHLRLTGRHKKRPKVPLPIVRGIRKAAARREVIAREEARKAGVVLPKDAFSAKAEAKKASRDAVYRSHGPAPNIGFMKGGVFRVSDKKKDKR